MQDVSDDQTVQVRLDPARVRIWAGNARIGAHLNETSCRDLIDSMIAEGGQKVPALVRRIEGDPQHDHEVIAGVRRHWTVRWLRSQGYPDMPFVAQVLDLDDEAAFRLADIENRARKDVSDIERARNYAQAIDDHYAGYAGRMATRLGLSKGWLSKMLTAAAIPDAILAAFAEIDQVKLRHAYPLARAIGTGDAVQAIGAAAMDIAADQVRRREAGKPNLPVAEVLSRLLAAPTGGSGAASIDRHDPIMLRIGNITAVSVVGSDQRGVTMRLHTGSGAGMDDLLMMVKGALQQLDAQGRGLVR